MTSPAVHRLDGAGLGLAAGIAVALGVATALGGGRPLPRVALVVATVTTLLVARRVARTRPVAVATAVAFAPVIALVVPGRSESVADPFWYANATGALLLVASGGALLVARSVVCGVTRGVAHAVALAWFTATWAVGAVAAGAFGALLMLVATLPRRPGLGRRAVAAGAALTVVGLALTVTLGITYTPGARTSLAERVVDTTMGELRVILWRDAVQLVREQPLRGIGPGRFADNSPIALRRDDASWAHNEYLQFAAETGVPAALLLLALVGWAFVLLWRVASDAPVLPAAVVLAGVAVNATIDYVWHFPWILLALAALVGTAAGMPGRSKADAAPAASGRARALVAATLALWIVLFLRWPVLNPAPSVLNGAASDASSGAVRFTAPGGIVSLDPPAALYRRLAGSHQATFEVVAATAGVDQDGPARIVSSSWDITNRNVTIGQDGDRLIFRLRTTATDRNGVVAELRVPGVFDTTEVRHVIVTSDLHRSRVYVDGELVHEAPGPGGSLDAWNHKYPLLLGNERTGIRPWRGEIRLLAIYDHPLKDASVKRRYARVRDGHEGVGDGPQPLALYTFEDIDEGIVHDHGSPGLGGDLRVPRRFPAPRDDFLTTFGATDVPLLARLMGHAALFLVWSSVLARHVRSDRSRERLGLVAGGGVVMVVASVLRHLDGRAPSAVDVVGALFGCAAGVVAAHLVHRRAGRGTLD